MWRKLGMYGLLPALMLLLLPVCGAAGGNPATLVSKVRVIAHDGMPMTKGEVQFFNMAGYWVMSDEIDAEGYIELDHGKLQPDSTYEISILNAANDEVYRKSDWRYSPGDFDEQWDMKAKLNEYTIVPVLRGGMGRTLNLEIEKTSNGEYIAWLATSGEVRRGIAPPKFLVAAWLPFSFGNFGANEDALAGVPETGTLFGVTLTRRFKMPLEMNAEKWFTYHEISFSYAGNRYTTDQAWHPEEQADVAFHRGSIAYGVGALKGRSDVSAALAVAFGGVYDGGTALEFLDRTYAPMVGFGLNMRYILRVLDRGSVDFGLMGQAELIYYPATSQENDHWYGLAPTVGVGVVMRVH